MDEISKTNEKENKNASMRSNKSLASNLTMRETDSIKIETDEKLIKLQRGKKIESPENKIFSFGNAECDQFDTKSDLFETRRPVEIDFVPKKTRISFIICGSQHTVILDNNGGVYTWGNADNYCLGRLGEEKQPLKVELPIKVNLAVAGDCYTAVANSATGQVYFWGAFISLTKGKTFQKEHPTEIEHYYFRKHGIKKLCGGSNHIIALSNKRAFTWGDLESGALGTVFLPSIAKKKKVEPEAVGIKSVQNIFSSLNCSFFITKNKVYACGLNGFNQLGLYSSDNFEQIKNETEEVLLENKPKIIPGIKPDDVEYISGGEHHNIILDKKGELFGNGKNDDGQLGEVDKNILLGNFFKISHVPLSRSILSSAHFNYSLDKDRNQYYSWGFGSSYVLANGKEDSLYTCHQISNERFFKGEPSKIALGHAHVVFSLGPTTDIEEVTDKLIYEKKKFAHKRSTNHASKKVNF